MMSLVVNESLVKLLFLICKMYTFCVFYSFNEKINAFFNGTFYLIKSNPEAIERSCVISTLRLKKIIEVFLL